MLLKSYADDFAYAQRLVASFHQHNRDSIHLTIVVPEADLAMFAQMSGANVDLLGESLFAEHLVAEPVHGLRPGYINQEIIKLAFWELGTAENYFCVDSEAVFIRDFRTADFMADDTTPYSVLVEDNELRVEPAYYHQYWVRREQEIRRIQELVELDDPVLRTCHGHQVFSSRVLQSLKSDFLAPRQWDYKDALAQSPYEFSWYNMWLQKSQLIDIHQREPLVKVFHNEGQHLEYILRGITLEDIARGYLAVVINSSFSRELGVLSLKSNKPAALAPYLSYGETTEVVLAKLRDTFRRRIQRKP